jgi:hypothetical protein
MNTVCDNGNFHIDGRPCKDCLVLKTKHPITNNVPPDSIVRKPPQSVTFTPKPAKARTNDPLTSHEAAADMTPERSAELQNMVLEFIAAHPRRGQRFCYENVGEECGNVTPRYAELEELGLITKDGRCCDGVGGRSVVAWRVTTAEERRNFVPRKRQKYVRIPLDEYAEFLAWKERFAKMGQAA